MHHVDFQIHDDKDKPKVLFPEFAHKVICDGALCAVAFVQNQTEQHKPGVNMLIVLDDGRCAQVGLTADMYLTLAAGMKGAMDRWGEPWEGA